MLFIVSIITFSHLLPGAPPRRRHAGDDRRPVRRAARRPRRPSSRGREARASPTRCPCSTGGGSRAIFVGARLRLRAGRRALPGAVLRLLVHHRAARSGRTCSTGCRSTVVARVGAAVIWLVFGVATGVVSALRTGSIFDRAAMGVALGRCLAADLLHRPRVAGHLQLRAAVGPRPAASYTPTSREPGRLGLRPDPAVDHARASSSRPRYARLTRAGMLETMSEDYVRTARAKGLPERSVVVKHGLRAALTPIVTIFGLDVGLLLGGAVLTESVVLAAGAGQVRDRRDRQPATCRSDGRDDVRPRSSSWSPT